MRYWIVVGNTMYDRLVVVSDVLKFKDRQAIFESNDGELVLALNATMWTSIQPMTVDEYFSSHLPEIKQKGE